MVGVVVVSCPVLFRRVLVAFIVGFWGKGESDTEEDGVGEDGVGGESGVGGEEEGAVVGEEDVSVGVARSRRSKSTEISFCSTSLRSSNSKTMPLKTSLSRNSSGSEQLSVRPLSCSHKNSTIVGSQSAVLSKSLRKCTTAASSVDDMLFPRHGVNNLFVSDKNFGPEFFATPLHFLWLLFLPTLLCCWSNEAMKWGTES